MRLTLCILSVATLAFMGMAASMAYGDDGSSALVFAWLVSLGVAGLTLLVGMGASLRARQFAWFGGLLAAGVIGLMGLVATLLVLAYGNRVFGGIQPEGLILVVPLLPAGVGLVGLAYSPFVREAAPAVVSGDGRVSGT